jgi:hypothetical protein
LTAIEINELSIKESLTNKRQSFDRNNHKNMIIFNDENSLKNKNFYGRQMNGSNVESISNISFKKSYLNYQYLASLVLIGIHILLFEVNIT